MLSVLPIKTDKEILINEQAHFKIEVKINSVFYQITIMSLSSY